MNIKGTGVAIVTPFDQTGQIDFTALAKLIEFLIAGQVDYLVVLGTTGETATLDPDEKKSIYQFVAAQVAGRIPLVAGLGGNYTKKVAADMAAFDIAGYHAFLSVSPYYNKPNQVGIIQHYTAIADASALPVILYNVPGRTGQNMVAATTLKLAEHPNIIGMKEASGNFEQCMEIMSHKPDGFEVVSGDDALTLPLMAAGMTGVISVIANAFPNSFSEMVRLILAGNLTSAKKLHYRLLPLMNTIFADGSPGGIKVLLEKLEICSTELRLPLAPVNQEIKTKLLDQLAAFEASTIK